MQTNKLSDFAIRNAKPGDTTCFMADGAGMFLEITPAGGKHKRISLGTCPTELALTQPGQNA